MQHDDPAVELHQQLEGRDRASERHEPPLRRRVVAHERPDAAEQHEDDEVVGEKPGNAVAR